MNVKYIKVIMKNAMMNNLNSGYYRQLRRIQQKEKHKKLKQFKQQLNCKCNNK